MAADRPGRRIGTAEGTSAGAFVALDWLLLTVIAGFWGSTFLFVAIGLDHFEPALMPLLRLGFGAAALAFFPSAYVRLERRDWPQFLAMTAIWITLPVTIIPYAQAEIDTSFAGMMSGAVPLIAAVVAASMLRRRPGVPQAIGLAIGFGGVVAIALPSTTGESANALGTGLMLIVILAFGVGTNLAVPLVQRYGAIPVMFQAQVLSAIVVLPLGLTGLNDSSFAWDSALSVVALGTLSGGAALIAMSLLGSRVGAPRANIAVYFVPIVAIALGVLVRNESVEPIAAVGIAFVLLGAAFASRADARTGSPAGPPAAAPANED